MTLQDLPQSSTVRSRLAAGLRDILPLAVGVGVYGLAFGLLAAQARMSGLQTGVMGTIVFAGSSQIIAVERLVAGAGAGAALLAGLALNLRLLLITASLRDEFAGRPWWQVLLGVHLATDENWALMHAMRARGGCAGYWYLVGGGLGLVAVWVLSTVAGATFAAVVPEPKSLGMDFAFTAAFIAILRSLWSGNAMLLPWAGSILIVLLADRFTPLDPTWTLILGGLGGAAIAGVMGND
ncbi:MULTISPECIES: AzlC family ABC transporter permease [Leisingera]|jgi:4-azaleucine resistance transporter AzlC|uniref:AzlC family ABC transporter permease n=1 Tax=Leisingera TaxID=191028 RepID=UPI00114D5C80|nr:MULTISPECIES: AzlC family ABC transporter permease [Leisingera]QDI77393.1 AzlC family protein [Leisingera aquaemixtae]